MWNFPPSAPFGSHRITRKKCEGFLFVCLFVIVVGVFGGVFWEKYWITSHEHEANYCVFSYTHTNLNFELRAKSWVSLSRRNRTALVWSHSHTRNNKTTYIKTIFMWKSTKHHLPKHWVHYSGIDLFALIWQSNLSPTGAVILASVLLLHCLIYCPGQNPFKIDFKNK